MENKIFEVGKKYTIYRINWMAITSKKEIQIVELRDTAAVFKDRGKRKLYLLPFESKDYESAPVKPFEGAVFEGWDQPIKCDSETNSYSGNACYNFLGTPLEIRAWIESGQLNPAFEKDRVLAVERGEPEGTYGIAKDKNESMVYPELYRPGYHAVIDRVMDAKERAIA